MSEERRKVVILGGGLSGVAAAMKLAEEGIDVTVVEMGPEVGGLATSRVIETEWGEFSFDTGPHRFYSQDPALNQVALDILGDNVVHRDRQSRILLYGRFFDYPLKLTRALVQLPKTVMIAALWDYFVQTTKNIFVKKKEENFEDWIVSRFGRKLFEIFFGVYTQKTWGIPCTQISKDWAAQRISQQSLWDAVKKSLFRPKNVRQLSTTFHYPARGGIGELSIGFRKKAEENGCTFLLDTTVERLRVEDGRVKGVIIRSKDGNASELGADAVLNTTPVNALVRMLEPSAPAEVVAHADAMKHRSMIFVYVILDRPRVTDDHWIYIPEASLTVHRLSEFKNFSEHCAPEDKTLVCGEITCDFGDDDWNKSDDDLRRIAVDDLVRIGLIDASEVLHSFTWRERYAYPLYTLDYQGHMKAVLDHIDSIQGLDTTGRQGLFKYNNMDHSVAMGFTAAKELLAGGEKHRKVATEQDYFG